MLKLTNYSVETDNSVLLQFEDGTYKRVSPNHIGQFVGSNDLKVIQGALKMRKSFFKRHVPRLGLAIMAAGLVALAGMTQQQQLNRLMHPKNPALEIASESNKATSRQTIPASSRPAPSKTPALSPSPGAVAGASTSNSDLSSIASVAPKPTKHTKHHWLSDLLQLNRQRP